MMTNYMICVVFVQRQSTLTKHSVKTEPEIGSLRLSSVLRLTGVARPCSDSEKMECEN